VLLLLPPLFDLQKRWVRSDEERRRDDKEAACKVSFQAVDVALLAVPPFCSFQVTGGS
jgi:hypothetical protein